MIGKHLAVPACVLAAVFSLSISLVPAGLGPDGRMDIVSVSAREFRLRGLAAKGLDLLFERRGRVYIVVSREEIASLATEQVAFTFETARFALPIPAPAAPAAGGLNGDYHSALELETELRLLEAAYPQIARVREIGRSLEGRPIYGLKISDNPAIDENEPAVVFLGCHHAREWISVEVPLLLGRHLLENYSTDPWVRALVDGGEIWVVPLVNPDGLEYSIHVYRYWRKNRRANSDGSFGVDLNRNYGYMWGTDNVGSSPVPSSDVYRGTAAFSEPETNAVRRLVDGLDVRAVVSFHSYSQVILYPWAYTTQPSPMVAELSDLARTMSGLMAAVRGTVYSYGQSASGIGYTSNGDTTDWTFGIAGIPSFTIELPPADVDEGGFFNDEAEIDGIFRENLPAMIFLAGRTIGAAPPTRLSLRDQDRRRKLPVRFKLFRGTPFSPGD
jgi:murein tripeptide amidase MpaA